MDAEFLKNTCPESLASITENDLVIWVDPLDGTTEYTQGILECVTVLIGVSVKNRAIGGIIHQPYYKHSDNRMGRTIWGLKGLGSSGFEQKPYTAGELIATTTRSHCNELVQKALDAIGPTKIHRVGGAGYKVLQLLEGDAHAYIFATPGCKKWDTCGEIAHVFYISELTIYSRNNSKENFIQIKPFICCSFSLFHQVPKLFLKPVADY